MKLVTPAASGVKRWYEADTAPVQQPSPQRVNVDQDTPKEETFITDTEPLNSTANTEEPTVVETSGGEVERLRHRFKKRQLNHSKQNATSLIPWSSSIPWTPFILNIEKRYKALL